MPATLWSCRGSEANETKTSGPTRMKHVRLLMWWQEAPFNIDIRDKGADSQDIGTTWHNTKITIWNTVSRHTVYQWGNGSYIFLDQSQRSNVGFLICRWSLHLANTWICDLWMISSYRGDMMGRRQIRMGEMRMARTNHSLHRFYCPGNLLHSCENRTLKDLTSLLQAMTRLPYHHDKRMLSDTKLRVTTLSLSHWEESVESVCIFMAKYGISAQSFWQVKESKQSTAHVLDGVWIWPTTWQSRSLPTYKVPSLNYQVARECDQQK